MALRLRALLLSSALLAVTACGAGAATTRSGQGLSDRGQSSGATAEPGSAARALTATTLAGNRFDFASLSGRPAVLWFWAPWCTICRVDAPEVVGAARRLGNDVKILGVPGRGKVPDMKGFVSDTGVGELEHVVDSDGRVWSAYGVVSQPAFAFIDAAGHVEVVNGALTGKELESRARALVA